MSDLQKMASDAKKASDARIEEAARARQIADDEKSAKISVLENQLIERVAPTLDEAAKAFELQGIGVSIKRSWDQYKSDEPTISFLCEGPRITNRHGGYETPKGTKIIVRNKCEVISVNLEQRSAEGIEQFGGDLSDGLLAATKHALETYLKSRENIFNRI